MVSIDEQIRYGWAEYYKAIGAGRNEEAMRIFDRVSRLAFARQARRTTSKTLAAVLPK